jgi:phosphoribosylamine--glycine ligase
LEFNARFGDPEAQVVLPVIHTDLLSIITKSLSGSLSDLKIEQSNKSAVGVVMASGGYPGNYSTGYIINGFETLDDDILIFHAGSKINKSDIVTSGGRVLTVVGRGTSISDARKSVYANINRISFRESFYRHDIAARI